MATLVQLPIYHLYDVPDNTQTKEQSDLIPFRYEYFNPEQLKKYNIRGFRNRSTQEYIPGLSVMEIKSERQYINVKMGAKELAEYLEEKWAEPKV